MARLASVTFTLLLAGCFPSGEGIAPPSARSVYFPVGLALDGDASHLFIANSDFDLQYNAGTLESWDLTVLAEHLPRACKSNEDCADGQTICDVATQPPLDDMGTESPHNPVPSGWCVERIERLVEGKTVASAGSPCPSGEFTEAERQLYPGRCRALIPAEIGIRTDRVQIGAFATDVVYRARPEADGTGRLFIPVRGDATLHFLEVDASGHVECGQDGADGECADAYRRGNNPPAENTRGLAMLPEPFGIDANETGEWLMVTNQASFAVGLFKNLWGSGAGYDNGPLYQYTAAGFPGEPMGVTSVPRARALPAADDLPQFLIGFRGAAQLDLLRVYPDSASQPPRPYAKAPEAQPIYTNANGTDSRGLTVDAHARRAEEDACAARYGVSPECAADIGLCSDLPADFGTCLQQAAAVPLDVLVTSRAPSSLLVGQTRNVISSLGTYDLPAFQAVVPLSYSPSRVVVGDIKNRAGLPERRAFAISFDSRRVLVYDIDRQRIDTEIVTGRGPQAIVIDSKRSLAYVAHFTDSYIGVVDLDQGHPQTYGVIIASVERPVPPRASK